MITSTLWTPNLGAPKVQLELGEELRSLGHKVEKLSFEDAFPESGAGPSGRTAGFMYRTAHYLKITLGFASRAKAYVRANAHRFDVVEAHQCELPYPKRELGFSGLLVARSVALIPAYLEFNQMARRKWPVRPSLRRLVDQAVTYPGYLQRLRKVAPSFSAADLINVSSSDDLVMVRRTMGFGDKVVHFPFGLSDARLGAFLDQRACTSERLQARTVAFIGTWNQRKGSEDWPLIAEQVLARLPDARFLFLGTGFTPDQVLAAFPIRVRERCHVVPTYDSEDLPRLLAPVTVGAFPGYLEGFGFSILEKLAAGLPTVTYDAPGPRDMMRHLAQPGMVPVGDLGAFARRLTDLLTLDPGTYEARSRDATRVARRFRWREIAAATAEVYQQRWDQLRGKAEDTR